MHRRRCPIVNCDDAQDQVPGCDGTFSAAFAAVMFVNTGNLRPAGGMGLTFPN